MPIGFALLHVHARTIYSSIPILAFTHSPGLTVPLLYIITHDVALNHAVIGQGRRSSQVRLYTGFCVTVSAIDR